MGRVRIKICGITRREDAVAAAEAGADMMGVNFYPASPRYVEPSEAARLISGLGVEAAGVFVNADPAAVESAAARAGVQYVQLHGDEGAEFAVRLSRPVIKVIRLSEAADLAGIEQWRVWSILIDSRTAAFGGSGKPADWGLAAEAARRVPRLILAGGLTPENVAAAVRAVRPWGVDVASGVESAPGIKDPEKIKKFIEAVKNVAG